ncbi:hypothetical protein Naga_100178g6 [Nannochloropsis gaditana]|uniref:Uncharacterized protein n=1 Tax=Nannochloropsis gaditana TaxID=72520 RepID=W7TH05_9STRA|nr:hypothetical protein Naga_100178g6 [Nannochloropsis gaditana]
MRIRIRTLQAAAFAFSVLFCIHVFLLNMSISNWGKTRQHMQLAAKPSLASSLLEDILVVISYHWNVGKLVYLTAMLDLIQTYETRVDVLIVTDNDEALHKILAAWGYMGNSNPTLQLWQAPTTDDKHKYSLLWAHRQAIEDAVERHPGYTSIFYMEDDTHLTWPTVVSWALDTEILEPLNFTRCIYRTEVDVKTGDFNMMDYTNTPLCITRKNVLDATRNDDFVRIQERLKKQPALRCGRHRDKTQWTCGVHDRFVSPTEPYQGMWMATRAQLARFMAHSFWIKEMALNATLAADMIMGYPERSTVMNLLINVPEGFRSNCMVPFVLSDQYDGVLKPILPLVARVEHMRNGYSPDTTTPLGKTHLQVAIKGKILLPREREEMKAREKAQENESSGKGRKRVE